MTKLRLLFSILFISGSPLLLTAQAKFDSVESFLKSTLKADAQLSDQARGDLNGDRLEDWAGVIHRRQPDSSPTYQLFVLLRLTKGGYQVAEQSIEEEIPGMGCCWLEDLQIRRSSIFIQNNAKTASTMEAATHQFKLHKNEWRLVGVKIYLTDHTPGAEGTIDTDTNLLTGLVIEKRQKGDNKPVVKSRRKKFAVYQLKNFDFSNGFGNE